MEGHRWVCPSLDLPSHTLIGVGGLRLLCLFVQEPTTGRCCPAPGRKRSRPPVTVPTFPSPPLTPPPPPNRALHAERC